MDVLETHTGAGRLLIGSAPEAVAVRYEYVIDRRNRVWRGTARRGDGSGPVSPAAGPALFETDQGIRAPVNYYHRQTPDGALIVFTGRGAPPGE